MDLEQKVDELEREMGLMKGEIKQTLVDLRDFVMKQDSPFSEGRAVSFAPDPGVDEPAPAGNYPSNDVTSELMELREEIRSSRAEQKEELLANRAQQLEEMGSLRSAQQTAAIEGAGLARSFQAAGGEQQDDGMAFQVNPQVRLQMREAAPPRQTVPLSRAGPGYVEEPPLPSVRRVDPSSAAPDAQLADGGPPMQASDPLDDEEFYSAPIGEQAAQEPVETQEPIEAEEPVLQEEPLPPVGQPDWADEWLEDKDEYEDEDEVPMERAAPEARRRRATVKRAAEVFEVADVLEEAEVFEEDDVFEDDDVFEEPPSTEQEEINESLVAPPPVPGPVVDVAAVDTNMVAGLMRWVGSVKFRLGAHQLAGFLEIYKLTGHLPPVVENLIHELAVLDVLPDQSRDQVFTLDDLVDSLLQLHAIVYGPGHAALGPLAGLLGDAMPDAKPADIE